MASKEEEEDIMSLHQKEVEMEVTKFRDMLLETPLFPGDPCIEVFPKEDGFMVQYFASQHEMIEHSSLIVKERKLEEDNAVTMAKIIRIVGKFDFYSFSDEYFTNNGVKYVIVRVKFKF